MTRSCLLLLLLHCASQASPLEGYSAKVTVSAPTRIDWVYTVATQSRAEPPAKFLPKDYDSKRQTYELFVPTRKEATKPLPAILFISAGDEPQGWKAFETTCKKLGFVFIGIRGAGNDIAGPKRCRIVLDCFDDVRRQVPLDADRTYIAGFSGGSRMAGGIGFALPEYFGGILSICASADLRDEPWLRHRAIDRLSCALITGTTDFNRGEIEKWRGPFWKDIGIRARVWTAAMGHALPSSATLTEAVQWLDEAKDKRAALAKKFPATRAPAEPLSREEDAKALLAEGRKKLEPKETEHAGLMLLKGVLERWPDLPSAVEAKKVLIEYERRPERSWEKTDIEEQVKYLSAEARALGDYALTGIAKDSQYAKQRPNYAKRAIELWSIVIQGTPNSDAAKDGKKQMTELEKLIDTSK